MVLRIAFFTRSFICDKICPPPKKKEKEKRKEEEKKKKNRRSSKYKKLILARLGVSRATYNNIDSLNLGFPYFNFLGEAKCKKHPVILMTILMMILMMLMILLSLPGPRLRIMMLLPRTGYK